MMPQPAPYAPPTPTPAGKQKLPGMAGIWIGVILMVLGAVGGIALVVNGARSFVDGLGDLQRVPISGGGTVLIEETGTQNVYAERPSPYGGTNFQTGTFSGYGPSVYLTVTGPNGSVYFDSNPTGSETYEFDGKQGVLLGKFDADVEGEYRIQTDAGADVAPYTTIAVGQMFDVQGIVGVLGGVFGGGLVFVVGLIVLIISIVRRSKARKRMQTPYDPYGGGSPGWVPPPMAGAGGAPAPWTPPGGAAAPTPWTPPGPAAASPPPTASGWAAPPVVAPGGGWQPAPPPAAPAPGAPAPWNPGGGIGAPGGLDQGVPADPAMPVDAPPADADGPVDPLR